MIFHRLGSLRWVMGSYDILTDPALKFVVTENNRALPHSAYCVEWSDTLDISPKVSTGIC